ncbi:MAG TPA: Ig domain-containing protein [Myxococcaceae bacterium]|nr:Ig domain-containing protein [Myxococcaceae bacterium]
MATARAHGGRRGRAAREDRPASGIGAALDGAAGSGRWHRRATGLTAALGAVMALASACTFSPDLSRYAACGADQSCPAGYECWAAENRCLPSCSTAPSCGGLDAGDDAGVDAGADAGIEVLPPALPAATELQSYRADFSADGGVAPYSFRALAPLPPGLQLSDAGVLSGVPEDAGTYPISLRVDDSSVPARTATADRTLGVRALLRLAGPVTLADAAAGQAYQESLSATGGDGGYRFSLADGGSLPVGLTLGPDGTISGTTNDAGAASFDVQVTDGDAPAQSMVRHLSINVVVLPITLQIASRSLPDGRLGTPYSYRLQRFAGIGASQWMLAAGTMPQNVGLDTSTGVISGTPGARGRSTITIQLKDGVGTTTTATFGVDVY